MNKYRTLLFCALSGFAGFFLGFVLVSWYWGHILSRSAVLEPKAGAFETLLLLSDLRKPDLNEATLFAEERLDGYIVSLGFAAEQSDSYGQEARQMLRRIAAYRKGTNYIPNDPEIRKSVENAFALTSKAP
jgi:hypothetical protein